jgi:NAD(P)-dependent dehydrogenase (short-subunit alcohol dehydrogenase family)
MMVFTNKIAVITGAASGIGAGLAREAARRGMRVVLADRNVEALSAVENEIGEAATAIPTDVTNASAVEALAEAVFQRHGAVDLLFNNAGVMTTGLSWEIPPEKWESSWKVNVEGILNGLRAFVPRMIAADRPARIINTASVGGFMPSPLMAPYSATKFAVVALTEALAGELKMLRTKIDVSLLAPGPVKSQIFRETPPEAALQFHGVMTSMLDQNGLEPDAFAALVFDGIMRGDYWIIPQPEALDEGFAARNDIITKRSPPLFYGVEGN